MDLFPAVASTEIPRKTAVGAASGAAAKDVSGRRIWCSDARHGRQSSVRRNVTNGNSVQTASSLFSPGLTLPTANPIIEHNSWCAIAIPIRATRGRSGTTIAGHSAREPRRGSGSRSAARTDAEQQLRKRFNCARAGDLCRYRDGAAQPASGLSSFADGGRRAQHQDRGQI